MGSARPICITPCEFDFEPGLHILRFDAGPRRFETVRLQVGSRRKLVRVAVGYEIASSDRGTTGVILQTLGASVALVGAMLWASSAAAPADKRENRQSTGIALTLGGAAGFLLGVPLAYRKPGTRQPSSITEVDLPPSAQTAM
jgi:hypothetical protein